MGSRRPFGMLLFTVVLAFVKLVDGQCNRASQTITTGSSSIQSPNFGMEYGKSANCSWKFNSLSNENALILTATKLKLYDIVDSRKICTGSYVLIMNGDKVQCDRYVNVPTTASFCKSFYFDSSCSTLSEVNSCETTKVVKFPLEVKYEADGTFYGSGTEDTRIWGFKMNYKFVKCPTRTTASPAIQLMTLSTAEKSITKVAGTTSSEIPQPSGFTTGHSSTTTPTETTAETRSTSANLTPEATAIAEGLKPNSFPLSVVAGLSGACGFLFISNIVLLCLLSKTRWRNDPVTERKSKDTPEGEYELPCSHHKYEYIEKADHHDANKEDSSISNKWMKNHDIEAHSNAVAEYEPRYGSSHHKYEDVENADHRGANNKDPPLTETPGYESFAFSSVNHIDHYEVPIPNPNASH